LSAKNQILFSVIIATRNRQEQVAGVIQCLIRQRFPKKSFEILVVDNGSTDLTCEVVHRLMKQTSNLYYFFLADPNVSAARNLGAAHARGNWLGFTDDDCLPPPDWLESAQQALQKQPKAVILGGPIFDVLPPAMSLPAGFHLAGWPESYGRRGRFLKPNEAFTECNLFIRKKEFEMLEGFSPKVGPGNRRFGFHEGTELQARCDARMARRRVRWYDPKILMRHLVRSGRATPSARIYRMFISGFDHARAFPRHQRHGILFLSLRAHLASLGALLLAMVWLAPGVPLPGRSGRYFFRCGEMWGEVLRTVPALQTHGRKRQGRRNLGRKILDCLLPSFKRLAAWLGAVNIHGRISLLDPRPALSEEDYIAMKRLPRRVSFYRYSTAVGRPAHPLLAHTASHLSPPGYRLVLRQARAYGPTPAVVDLAGNLIEELSRDWGKEGIQLGILRALTLPTARVLKGKTFLAATLGGETYFHWMTDSLPILLEEQQRSGGLESYDFFLAPARLQEFHRETFRRLKIPNSKIVSLAKGMGWACEELTCFAMPHVSGRPPVETLRAVGKFFQAASPASGGGRKLAILRSAEVSRPLSQRESILRELRTAGFEEYEPSRDSIEEQARVFAAAEVIVATHGAALTNLIFCRPGTRVVELFSSHYVNPCYAHICRQLGLQHRPVIDQAIPGRVQIDLRQATAPIEVSTQAVREALRGR